jgi:quercetin 2,3-dioxygenase
VMTAGRGIRHSEFNPSNAALAHFLQIWIMPEKAGLPPAYAQKPFPAEGRRDRLQRVAGRDRTETDGALKINQDADVFLADLSGDQPLRHSLRPGRGLWVHVVSGRLRVGDQTLGPGDAAATQDAGEVELAASGQASIVAFDLA